MKTKSRFSFLYVAAFALAAMLTCLAPCALAGAHTPPAGSAERKAVCDALREYVVARFASRKPPQPIVFKVSVLRIDDGLAWFEGTPLLKDGSFVPTDILPDIGYTMVLKETAGGWKVVHNLSRSDVPSDSEAAQLRAELRDIPTSIIPESWRRILQR